MWRNNFILIPLFTLYITTAGMSIVFLQKPRKYWWNEAFYISAYVTRESLGALADSIAKLASAMTTVIATFFIVLKIALVTRNSPTPRSYAKIIGIIVESGAIVSVLMIFLAVLQMVFFFHPLQVATTGGKFFLGMWEYLSSFQLPIIVSCPPFFHGGLST